ncbi:MAG: hypothetical protein B6229_00740 [Spirochaetaceae bacterium 4572_7]|nr:MAG: hypothetical protein B6229_00740 [Spirochaetaceae bacterium 4572_7]
MLNVVFVSGGDIFESTPFLERLINFHRVFNIKEALIYQIENPSINGIIYDSKTLENRDIQSSLKKSNTLNPMILQFVLGDIELTGKLKANDSIFIIKNINDIHNVFTKHNSNRRESNRAYWPIQVNYHKNDKSRGNWGLILSISVGGCFIKTEHFELGVVGDMFIMDIHFNDFNFLVEGEVVRVQRIANMNSPQGFSIKFISPSVQTKDFIEEIINDKIISTLFMGFAHLEGSNN